MTILYDKSGFQFTTNIYDGAILEELSGTDFLDQITIFQMVSSNGYFEVGFRKNDVFSGNAVFTLDGGEPVLKKYEFN